MVTTITAMFEVLFNYQYFSQTTHSALFLWNIIFSLSASYVRQLAVQKLLHYLHRESYVYSKSGYAAA